MAARVFIWITTGGGAWAIAANWDDLTDATSPSQLVPGSQDSVSVTGPAGISVYALTGAAKLAAAQFAGNVILSGNVTATTLTAGSPIAGGLLQLAAGTSLQSATATLAGGSLLVNGTGTAFGVAGELTLGSVQTGAYGAAADLNVTAGGHASVLGVFLRTGSSQIYVDPTSVLEIGTLSTGAAGKLTIDTGYLLLGQGNADEYGALVDNGSLFASGGTLAVGAVTGYGHVGISANAVLLLNGACGPNELVEFSGANATLDIAAEADAPQGTITGFATGDVIDFRGSPISAAVYNASSANGGVLTLYYGNQVAAQLSLAGSYTTSTFLTAGDGSDGTLINVAAAIPGSGTLSPGTTAPDQYAWVATGSGAWGAAANWQDLTLGTNPAAIAPGAHDSVSIAASPSGFTVIAGPASASTLSITGEVALTGTYGIGLLSIGIVSAGSFTAGSLDLLAGTLLNVNAVSIGAGAISASGTGAVLATGGTLNMGGGYLGVGLPVTALSATAGGKIRVGGGLVIGGGSGDSVTTDPSGAIEFGTLGNPAPGAVTIDAGASVTGNGSINPFGAIIDNGSITATGGALVLGSVTGSGALSIGAGALELTYATALPIAFASATSTLAIAGPAATPSGTLSGLVAGDVIDLLGSPVTNVQYVSNTGSAGGTLVMLYNGQSVGRLATTSNFKGLATILSSDGQEGTDIAFAVGSGGGGGTGQTGTDPLVWTGAANGNWSAGVNWNDTVTGKPATLPPGAQTAAQITGPSGTNFQSISGTGSCASLLLDGNGFFFGSFTAGSLALGQDATSTAAATAGTLVTTVLTTFSLGTCLIADGAFLVAGSKTALDVAGDLAVSDGGITSVLAITQHAIGQAGTLSLGGGSVSADPFSSLEIGTLGGAATGLITIDAGAVASGYGSLGLLGSIADNGTIQAAGGTLLLGSIAGGGIVRIATEAALGLTAATSVPIAMTGAGATLILDGAAASATGMISGFAPGDSIVTSNTPADSVAYQPGAGGLGTLSLSEAGHTVESLTLAGSYAGDLFSVQPDGAGAAVIVTAPGGGAGTQGAPPPGTVTPDHYVWTGTDGVLWSDVKNWVDSTQSQSPAVLAPGQNDFVTIVVPAGQAQLVTGPADAASLSLTGSVALLGSYGIGTLMVGAAQQTGVLALGGSASVAAASADVLGGLAGQGGSLAIGGTLTLGQAGQAGLVSATGSSAISADTIVMLGLGSEVLTDATATIEIGGVAQGAPGSITIDPSGLLIGAGAANPAGQIVDNGLVTASLGTLVLGNVSGAGTLLVGVAASMVVEGAVAAGLTVDFAAGGILNLAGGVSGFAGAIADFGPGDQILLPVSGATQADYVITGPGIGVLTLYAGNQAIAQLTLLGSQADNSFSVAGSAGGGTILTATPSNTAGEGGNTVGDYPTTSGGTLITPSELYALAPFADNFLQALNDGPPNYNEGDYEYFMAGDTTVVGPGYFSTIGQPGLDALVVGPLTGEVGAGGFGPGYNMVLAPGYTALIALGTEQINLIDQVVGNSLLIGNQGADGLATFASNDTLVGGAGANTAFYASGGTNVVIQGGGDDTITSTDNSLITTSGGQSDIFLGASTNNVVSDGTDRIVCSALGISDNTITENAVAGKQGDTVFGPQLGSVIYDGGAAPGTVVGTGGQVVMNGGAGNGNVLWAGNSYAQYNGSSGAAIVVGGSQALLVQGGSGPTTVYGGTGPTVIEGTAGNSLYVVGFGPATISAASGNRVYIEGNAQVSVAGEAGALAYAGNSTAGDIFQANAGSETLWGGAGNDTFFAGSGAGTFVSGGGADIFNFTNGLAGGTEIIDGFIPGLDTIALHGYGLSAPQLNVVNGSTVFTLSDGTQVQLYNVTNMTGNSIVNT